MPSPPAGPSAPEAATSVRSLLQSDLDYVRGINSWRAGIQLDGGRSRSDDSTNYLGTYTFASLEAYEAGRPTTYTRRIGDPYIGYWNMQSALYLQDDIRVRKTLTLSPGVRIEAQTHVDDKVNIGPRFGVTWAPFKGGKTTLRVSAGMFYDWLPANTYEQTLRVDGQRQQELIISDPPFPATDIGGTHSSNQPVPARRRSRMTSSTRLSAGFEQQIRKAIRLGAVYSHVRGQGLLVGQNLNAPVNGVRPEPTLANVIEAVPAGESRADSLQATLNLNFSPPAMAGVTTGPRFAWRRGLLVVRDVHGGPRAQRHRRRASAYRPAATSGPSGVRHPTISGGGCPWCSTARPSGTSRRSWRCSVPAAPRTPFGPVTTTTAI